MAAARAARACASAPFGHWTRVSVLGALGHEGIVGAMGVEAATSGAVFHAYLDRVLLPELRRAKPDAVLVMDNLPAHKAPHVRALLEASGFGYRYLPAYSPDLNPIEPAWAKVKAELRRVAARTADALHEALGPALGAISPQHAAGFFRHCGYSRPGWPAKRSRPWSHRAAAPRPFSAAPARSIAAGEPGGGGIAATLPRRTRLRQSQGELEDAQAQLSLLAR